MAHPDSSEHAVYFMPGAGSSLLNRSRRSKNFVQLEIDRDALARLQALKADAENQVALAYYESAMFDKANAAIDRALGLDDTLPIYWLNSALIKANLANIAGAVRAFRTAQQINPELEVKQPYLYWMAHLLGGAAQRDIEGVTVEQARELIQKALSDAGISPQQADRLKTRLATLPQGDGVKDAELRSQRAAQ